MYYEKDSLPINKSTLSNRRLFFKICVSIRIEKPVQMNNKIKLDKQFAKANAGIFLKASEFLSSDNKVS